MDAIQLVLLPVMAERFLILSKGLFSIPWAIDVLNSLNLTSII